ncbi:MAG: pyridoxamine 5'-phosphate oxidase family protein [Promethearchaeota archaeon]
MTKRSFTFEFVEEQIRKKSFGTLSTVSPKGRAHSTGMLYGVSPPGSKFYLYCLTGKIYTKVRNIENNSYVAFVIPFPHYYFRFAPSSCVAFQGTAELVPYDDQEARKAYGQKRILKMVLKQVKDLDRERKRIFIKIKPNRKIFCYGLGIGIMKIRKDAAAAAYTVMIPPDRL